jgi:hypothetical protein
MTEMQSVAALRNRCIMKVAIWLSINLTSRILIKGARVKSGDPRLAFSRRSEVEWPLRKRLSVTIKASSFHDCQRVRQIAIILLIDIREKDNLRSLVGKIQTGNQKGWGLAFQKVKSFFCNSLSKLNSEKSNLTGNHPT